MAQITAVLSALLVFGVTAFVMATGHVTFLSRTSSPAGF
jgi:hypothetical protein